MSIKAFLQTINAFAITPGVSVYFYIMIDYVHLIYPAYNQIKPHPRYDEIWKPTARYGTEGKHACYHQPGFIKGDLTRAYKACK